LKNKFKIFSLSALTALLFSCKNENNKTSIADSNNVHSCMQVPKRFADSGSGDSAIKFNGDTSVQGMVFINGGTFDMGGDNEQADPDELPKHKVQVSGLYGCNRSYKRSV